VATLDTLITEIEFESLAELAEFWNGFWSDPDTPEFMGKWNQLVERGGETDIWNLVA
jgi:hypothetical protein